MTVSVQTPVISYTGNGSTTVFAYNFRVDASADLKVYLDTILQGSGYTLSGLGTDGGGDVTFTTAPTNGAVVKFIRKTTYSRTTDYTQGGAIIADTLDLDIDRTVLMIQEFDSANLTLNSSGNLDLLNGRIVNVGNPVNNQDVVTKAYGVTNYVGITGDYTIAGNLVLNGDVTINGTMTTIDATNLEISDPEIVLNKGELGAGVTAGASGITIDRGSSTDARIVFNESDDLWKVDVGSGSLVALSLVTHTHAESLETMGDVATMTKATNDLLSWNGSAWTNTAQSTFSLAAHNHSGVYLENLIDDTTPQLGGDLDVNGKNFLSGTETIISLGSSTSNGSYIKASNDSVSSSPTIETLGTDTNIDLWLKGKGTGSVSVSGTLQVVGGATTVEDITSSGMYAISGSTIGTDGFKTETTFRVKELASHGTTVTSGYGDIYGKTDGKLYHKNNAGTETELTAIGAASSMAGMTDTTITSPVSGHLMYHNGTVWVNGTPGTAGVLPLTGGTLTGALTGTAATFTGQVKSNSVNVLTDLSTQKFGIQFALDVGEDATFTVDQDADIGYTIDKAYYQTVSGTITVNVKINGVSITGLSALSLTSTEGNATASAAKTVVAGDKVTITTTSNSTAVKSSIKLKCSRT